MRYPKQSPVSTVKYIDYRLTLRIVQPFDHLVLRSLKVTFRERWNHMRNNACIKNQFTQTGRVMNPGKHSILLLIQQSISNLNERMCGNINVPTKSMILSGMIPNSDGLWNVSQLTPELQTIVHDNMVFQWA